MPKLEDRKGVDRVVSRFTITHYENGALSVEGQISDKAYAVAVLQNAIDAIRNNRSGERLVTPGKDVSVVEPIAFEKQPL